MCISKRDNHWLKKKTHRHSFVLKLIYCHLGANLIVTSTEVLPKHLSNSRMFDQFYIQILRFRDSREHMVVRISGYWYNRTESRLAPSQWEPALLCNDVSHWLGASLESALHKPGSSINIRRYVLSYQEIYTDGHKNQWIPPINRLKHVNT